MNASGLMHAAVRLSRLALLAVAACALAACVTTTERRMAPVVEASEAAPEPSKDASASAEEPKGESGLGRAGKIVATVPENIVWIPWKMIGTAFKGAGDGVSAGYQKGNMPLVATVFAPVNLAIGFVNGFVEGLIMPPALIGPADDFGRTMSLPTSRKTTVWWY